MDSALVDQIVNAVLYEGYILYPYRPSVKNVQRWTFGGIYPRAYSEKQSGSDAWSMQTECLVRGNLDCTIRVKIRFLHLLNRFIKQLDHPQLEWNDNELVGRIVESLQIGNQRYQTWQEAVEREIAPEEWRLDSFCKNAWRQEFRFPSRRTWEPIHSPTGEIVAFIEREQETVIGSLEVNIQQIAVDLFKIAVRIENHTPLGQDLSTNREEALLRSLISTHTILHATNGEFISLLDPPTELRELASTCRNIGTWPVLVGESGVRDTMLSSPIIIYDYPEIAQESPGDLFDATEIDEILSLRILTLTDEEKESAIAVDDRVRAMLQRTESLAEEQFLGLHGAIRERKMQAPEGFS